MAGIRKGGLALLGSLSELSHAIRSSSNLRLDRFYNGESHSTTVLCVRKDGDVVLVADGQVTMGGTIVKPNVKKTRRIGEHVVGGFAGATADAFTLFERLETKLEEHPGAVINVQRVNRNHVAAVMGRAHFYGTALLLNFCFAGQLTRAAVELAKMWRMDKYLRRLDVSCLPMINSLNTDALTFVLQCLVPLAGGPSRRR